MEATFLHCGFDPNVNLNYRTNNRLVHEKITMTEITRREFLRYLGIGTLGLLGPSSMAANDDWARTQLQYFQGQDVLKRILQKSSAEKWRKLPIGKVIGKVAMELAGTPWMPFTLDVSPDAEYCVVNLKGVDCFTFIENSLCLARMIKRVETSPEDLVNEVQFTLYREGKMGDFTTRLHYISDWFFDNEKKGVLKILTPELPGAETFPQKIDFMTKHPGSYKQLKSHPELTSGIKAAEDRINARSLKYLPMDSLKDAEHLLQTGDLVGVTTTKGGLDIGHCGLCLKDENGVVHFVDASSIRRKMRVTYEPEMVASLNRPQFTGVMIVRPLEVGKSD